MSSEHAPVPAPDRRDRGGERRQARRSIALAGPGAAAPAPPARRLTRGTLRRTLTSCGDVLTCAIALVLFGVSGWLSLPLLALYPAIGSMLRIYGHDQRLLRADPLDEVPRLLEAAALYVLVVAVVLQELPPVSALAVVLGGSVGVRVIGRALSRRFDAPVRCLVIGEQSAAEHVQRTFDLAGFRASVVGRVPLPVVARERRLDATDLVAVVQDLSVERIVIAPADGAASEQVANAVRCAKVADVSVTILPDLLQVVGPTVAFEDLDGAVLLSVSRFGMSRGQSVLKRAFDLFGAAWLLLALAPLMLAIAAWIRLSSPGPALFRQKRAGQDGRPFEIFKFRTMVTDAEALKDALRDRNEAGGGLFKIADDPRVTSAGRWLRRTSLDELPQLFNVVRGEMSLVGPRPLVLDENAQILGWNRRRAKIKPGMTGRWQALGSARIPLPEMLRLDYLYAANWSLWGDVKILVRTALFVVRRRGI